MAMAMQHQRTMPFPAPRRQDVGYVNLDPLQRWLSVLGGGALALWGLERGGLAGLGVAALGGTMVYRGASGHCALLARLGVNASSQPQGPASSIPAGRGIRVEHTVTIHRSPEEVYRFWRNFENLPRFMHHLESVRNLGGNRSHWSVRAPLGSSVEWDADIVTDRPPELISWRSLPGADVQTAGSVHFRRALGGGTEVHVELKYNPPAGVVGATIARIFGQSPEQQIRDDLHHFKQILESGAAVTAQGGTR